MSAERENSRFGTCHLNRCAVVLIESSARDRVQVARSVPSSIKAAFTNRENTELLSPERTWFELCFPQDQCSNCNIYITSYVSGLEQRLESLEQLLRTTNPGINLDDVVPEDPAFSQNRLSTVLVDQAEPVQLQNFTSTNRRASTPEALPAQSSGFDWGNGEAAPAAEFDGASTAAISPEGVGYLGSYILPPAPSVECALADCVSKKENSQTWHYSDNSTRLVAFGGASQYDHRLVHNTCSFWAKHRTVFLSRTWSAQNLQTGSLSTSSMRTFDISIPHTRCFMRPRFGLSTVKCSRDHLRKHGVCSVARSLLSGRGVLVAASRMATRMIPRIAFRYSRT